MVRASSARNAAPRSATCAPVANGSPTSWHRGNGWCSSPGPRATASACWDGRTAPARCCGRCVRNSSSRGIEPDFRSAVAFYPDCRISSGLGWSARVPTLLLIGAKDDVSSPPACRQMVMARAAAARWRGSWSIPAPITISTAPNLPLRAIAGIRCRAAGTRPSRHRRGSARDAQRRVDAAVAGAVDGSKTNFPGRPAWRRAWARPALARRAAGFRRSCRGRRADPHPPWRRRGRRRIR